MLINLNHFSLEALGVLPDSFNRKHAPRNVLDVAKPRIFPWVDLKLPEGAVVHSYSLDTFTDGPDSSWPVFRNEGGTHPLVYHFTDLRHFQGHPRKVSMNMENKVRDFHKAHRMFKRITDLKSAHMSPKAMLVANHCMIGQDHTYTRSAYSAYYLWRNVFDTMIDNISEMLVQLDRPHYLFMVPPTPIPAPSAMLDLARKVDPTSLQGVANKPEAFMFTDIWKWLGPMRTSSKLYSIPHDKLHLLNVIVVDSFQNWCIIPLGLLNAIRNHTKDDTGYHIQAKQTYHPLQVQTRFIGVFLSLMEKRLVITDENGEAIEQQEQQLDQESDQETIDQIIAQEDQALQEKMAQLEEFARKANELHHESQNEAASTIEAKKPGLPEDRVVKTSQQLLEQGMLTPGQAKRFESLANKYKEIVVDGGQTLEEFVKIPPQDKIPQGENIIPDSFTIPDKSMLNSTLTDLVPRYATKIYRKDVARMILALQQGDFAVTGYAHDTMHSLTGSTDVLQFKLTPVVGEPSTHKLIFPTLLPDGSFRTNGSNYRLKGQIREAPISKVAPDRVALVSLGYGKTFLTRGRKRINNYEEWLTSELLAIAIDPENTMISELITNDVFDNTQQYPTAYSAIAMRIESFTMQDWQCNFNAQLAPEFFGESVYKDLRRKKMTPFGKNAKSEVLVLDTNNTVYIASGEDLQTKSSLEEFFGLDFSKAPISFVELTVFGKEIPIGVVLGYYMGLTKLMNALGVKPKRYPTGTRFERSPSEYTLQFSDETLVFNRYDRFASLILASFNEYHRTLKNLSLGVFDSPGVYLNLLEANQLTVRYLKELDLMNSYFIDPITLDALRQRKQPETFQGILFYATRLLVTDRHWDAGDNEVTMYSGNERFAGAVYSVAVDAMRVHMNRPDRTRAKVEINPFSVNEAITTDSSKLLCSELNPIQQLKEIELFTYTGRGGRNKRSMVRSTRVYRKSQFGKISEGSVDSSDVGVNVQASANPLFTDVYGTPGEFDMKKNGITSLLSPSALISFDADKDDPKRTGFAGIQQTHAIATVGYHQCPFVTGYESVIPHRNTEIFCKTAKQKGKVIAKNDKGIIVEFADGTTEGFYIGTYYGAAAGLHVPHRIVSPLEVGEVFEPGQAIVYNTGFFEPDILNPKFVIWKNSLLARTVLLEDAMTLEDSSMFTDKLAAKLATQVVKIKPVRVEFTDAIRAVVEPGQKVKYDSPLCIIEDAVTARNNVFDTDSIAKLNELSSPPPTAGVEGVVERVEVLYYGELEDMSESLREHAQRFNKLLKQEGTSRGRMVFTGRVDSSLRIENDPILPNQVVLKFYITQDVPYGVADKAVNCNQLKTVTGSIQTTTTINPITGKPQDITGWKTEDGRDIDAVFGRQSVDNRIVGSADLQITATPCLFMLQQRFARRVFDIPLAPPLPDPEY